MAAKYKINSSDFIAASDKLESLPRGKGIEICLVGRSNVGKSSLINKLVGRRSLARVGKTPGSTKVICLYEVKFSETRSNAGKEKVGTLADLPGYGYAKTSYDNRELWSNLISSYLVARSALKLVVLLVDVRRDLGEEEKQLLNLNMPWELVIALTKADKIKKNELAKRLQYFKKESGLNDDSLIVTSSESSQFKVGLDGLRDRICAGLIEKHDD